MNISCGKLFLGQPVSFNYSMCVLGNIHSHLWEINQVTPYIKYIFPFHFNSSLKQSKLNSNNDSSDGNHRNNRPKDFLHPQLLIDLLLSFWFRFRGGGVEGDQTPVAFLHKVLEWKSTAVCPLNLWQICQQDSHHASRQNTGLPRSGVSHQCQDATE